MSDEAAVMANRSAEFPPAIGSNAFVVVNLACAGLRRCSRQGVTTLHTTDQPLHGTWRDGTPARSYLVLVEQLLGTGKAFFRHQGGHGGLDPLFREGFCLELQDPNARRKLRRLSQRFLKLSHALDHIAQEWVGIGQSTHGRT